MMLRLFFVSLFLAFLLGATTAAAHAGPNVQAVPVTVTVAENANLRAGPGTAFDRVGGVPGGESVQVVACNSDCTWFQTADGAWIAAELLLSPPALPPAGGVAAPAPSLPVPAQPAPALPAVVLPAPVQNATGKAITTVTGARQALVRIEAAGTFLPLGETETVLETWLGTGFIINPEGIVVTNAHVVNGGEAFLVYLDGETRPRYATVLGISECSDLAVLDIRGSGYPYLSWADTAPRVGQRIYAIGYPGGKYRSSRGTIEETHAVGDTAWASVGNVIQHTAKTAPGSSGGPILNQDGEVLGVSFANNSYDQSSAAISWEEALPIIYTLAAGADLDSIGINGEAFLIEQEDLFGIWVVSVEAGSPAAASGIQPADILLGLEEIPVGIDGSLGSYCTVLRSHAPGDIMRIDLIRLDTQEYLCGQINGKPLANCTPEAITPDAPQQNQLGAYANGIYLPAAGSTISGYVSIQGVVVHPTFAKWQLDLLIAGVQETFLAAGASVVPAPGELLVLDTSLYPNGEHILRLRVVKRDGNYDEYFAPVSIQN